jgi:hypothetical protein
VWLLAGFFGYLRLMVGTRTAETYINQFLGAKAAFGEALHTSLETLVVGMAAWAFFACLEPRLTVLALPWVWGPCSERWAMRMLATTSWHEVRYIMPMAAIVLAAGLVGYARLAGYLRLRRTGLALLATVWACAALFCIVTLRNVSDRLEQVPVLIDGQEAEQIWAWIAQVDHDDAVMASYEVSAPLSSRAKLYSYVLDANHPKGFPQLAPEFHWLFIRKDYPFLKRLLDQGFEVVHDGKSLTIARRGMTILAQNLGFFRFCANTDPR